MKPGRALTSPDHVQLIETGTTADYLEDWRLLPSSLGDTFAFRLSDSTARTGVLLIAGQHFMFVADRQQPLAASGAVPPQRYRSSMLALVTPVRLCTHRRAA